MVTTVPPAVVPDDGLTVLMIGVVPPRAGETARARVTAPARTVVVRRGVMSGSGSRGRRRDARERFSRA